MEIPSAFRSLRLLRNLNIAGVGLTLAALTSLVFGYIFQDTSFGQTTLITGLPTLLIGALWARLLRWKQTTHLISRHVRTGWLLSIPLAALNAGLAVTGLLLAEPSGLQRLLEALVGGVFLGVTIGAIFWVPALVLTLLLFGLPIARAQRQAEQGLSGEERGERTVGLVNLILSLLVFVGIALAPESPRTTAFPGGIFLLFAMALGGLFTGGLAAALAHLRSRDRSRFVAAVEEGKIKGFRVDSTEQGKVLLRVSSEGEGYRAADFDEELLSLDDEGEAREELRSRTRVVPSQDPLRRAARRRR